MSGFDDFVFCDERWDGEGGSYSLVDGQVVRGHVCAQHRPGHEMHVCCCGAVKDAALTTTEPPR